MIWLKRRDEGEAGAGGDGAAGWIVWMLARAVPGLVDLPARLRRVIENPDFSDRVIARLFPPAYSDDPEAESEYQELLREELLRRKLETIELVERSLARRKIHRTPQGPSIVELSLSDGELARWISFIHDLRLTIGTALDITDESWERELDPDAPDFEERLLLVQLSYLEESFLEAIREAEGLDETD